MDNKDFEQFEGVLPTGWSKAYVLDANQVAASQVASFKGTGQAARITAGETTCGIQQALGAEITPLTGDIEVRAAVSVQSGVANIQLRKADETSVFFGARVDARSGGAMTDNNWVHLDGGEYFRVLGYWQEAELQSGEYWLGFQKSGDSGQTWGAVTEIHRSAGTAWFIFGGIYLPEIDTGYLICLERVGTNPVATRLLKFTSRMTVLAASGYLNDPAVTGWARYSEGRIIRLQSGTLVFPTYSYPVGSNVYVYDAPSGFYRSTDNGNTWSYAHGTPAGYSRGMVEAQAVERPDGSLYLFANTTSGYLRAQIWTDDGQTPGAVTATALQSPRSKHDLVRLSDGSYALGWCSYNKVGDSPRPVVMVAFSDDCATWRDLHTVAISHAGSAYLYEIYLQELADGRLRVRYWDYNGSTDIPYDVYADLAEIRRCRAASGDTATGETVLRRVAPRALLDATSTVALIAAFSSATFDADNVAIGEFGVPVIGVTVISAAATDITLACQALNLAEGETLTYQYSTGGGQWTTLAGSPSLTSGTLANGTWRQIAGRSALPVAALQFRARVVRAGVEYLGGTASVENRAGAFGEVIPRALTAAGYVPCRVWERTATGWVRRKVKVGQ